MFMTDLRRAPILSLALAAACSGDIPVEGVSVGQSVGESTIMGGSDTTTAAPTSSDGAATTASTTDAGTSEASAAESSDGSDSSPATTTAGAKFDVGAMPDLGMADCVNCALTVDSHQSGALGITGPNVFATAELQGQVVYALGTHGEGRFIAVADSSLPFNEVTDCPLLAWLAGTQAPNPKLFWFGWGMWDGPADWDYPGVMSDYHLPPEYVGHPEKLAADFDIVYYIEGTSQANQTEQPTDEEMQTVLDYVSVYGGGLYVSSEYVNLDLGAYLTPADIDSVNRLMKPLGVEALLVDLDWGGVNGEIDFACFPTPPG